MSLAFANITKQEKMPKFLFGFALGFMPEHIVRDFLRTFFPMDWLQKYNQQGTPTNDTQHKLQRLNQ